MSGASTRSHANMSARGFSVLDPQPPFRLPPPVTENPRSQRALSRMARQDNRWYVANNVEEILYCYVCINKTYKMQRVHARGLTTVGQNQAVGASFMNVDTHTQHRSQRALFRVGRHILAGML
jgi:hypothetical protein